MRSELLSAVSRRVLALLGALAVSGPPSPGAAAAPLAGGEIVDLAVGTPSCVVVRDGSTVWCWGGSRGRDAGRPQAVPGVHDAVQVVVAGGLACARTRAGEVACWGEIGRIQNS